MSVPPLASRRALALLARKGGQPRGGGRCRAELRWLAEKIRQTVDIGGVPRLRFVRRARGLYVDNRGGRK